MEVHALAGLPKTIPVDLSGIAVKAEIRSRPDGSVIQALHLTMSDAQDIIGAAADVLEETAALLVAEALGRHSTTDAGLGLGRSSRAA